MARPDDPLVSVVVPVLDEQECVAELVRRIHAALEPAGTRHEILFVDDGSQDETPERLAALSREDPHVRSLHFTRNFGHQAALSAGLEHAAGDVVVTMDGDLQHPPELLPALLRAWRDGADVVHTRRARPAGARADWKERTGQLFYRAMSLLTQVPVIRAGADFRLLDRRVVDAFNSLEERFVFARGLIPWLGFRQDSIEYEVGERFGGESKYDFIRMLRLALDGIFSFSVWPLRAIGLLGVATTLFGVAFGIYALITYVTGRAEAAGWTSVVVLILIFGGIQLLSIGILSEYVGRVYEEIKRRPRFVVAARHGFPTDDSKSNASPAQSS